MAYCSYFCTGLSFWKSTERKIFAVKAKVKKEEDVVVVEDNDNKNGGDQGILNVYMRRYQVILSQFDSIGFNESYFLIHFNRFWCSKCHNNTECN